MNILVTLILLIFCLFINIQFIKGARHYHEIQSQSTEQFINSWNR